jgi:tetratricopeptide (TPR) repeat protein
LLLVLLVNQAACKLKTKDYGEALALCNQALAKDEHHFKARYRRAVALKCRGEFDRARDDYERVQGMLNAETDPMGAVAAAVERDLATLARHSKKELQQTRKKYDGVFNKGSDKGRDLYADKPDKAPGSSGDDAGSGVMNALREGWTQLCLLPVYVKLGVGDIWNEVTERCCKRRSKTKGD